MADMNELFVSLDSIGTCIIQHELKNKVARLALSKLNLRG